MTESAASYRRILWSSSIIGGASFITALAALARMKVLAVLLGPAGVGLFSLYTGLLFVATAVASMGMSIVGPRRIAESIGHEDARAFALVRRTLLWGALLLATAGGLIVWSLREPIAVLVLGSARQADIVGWLALGVALSVVSTSQGALIQGMRRVGDMAQLNVYGALLNTLLGIALLWQWGEAALVAYVLVGPVVSFVLGRMYVSRLPKPEANGISIRETTHELSALLRAGIAFMGAGLATWLIQLWTRVEVGSTLGAEALGHYQAAWMISMQYIAFVLGAMGADYYPRLTGVIRDHDAVTKLVNEQTEIALLLSAPVFIAMMGLAPWVIQLLYSADFAPAVEVLRWQILGDVLKVASWPIGFVLLAWGDGKTFFWTETSALMLMGILIVVLMPSIGLEATGIAFLVCHCYLAPLVYVIARQRIGFRWSGQVVRLLCASFVICASLGLLAYITPWAPLVACAAAVVFGIYTFGRLSHITALQGPAGRIGAACRRSFQRFGLWRD